jgi:hypothetical protein
MALHALGRRRHTVASLRALCPTSSVWTIDLARLLHVCGARVALCSLILGARPECRAQRYYADTSPDDLRRVDRAFQVRRWGGASRRIPGGVRSCGHFVCFAERGGMQLGELVKCLFGLRSGAGG